MELTEAIARVREEIKKLREQGEMWDRVSPDEEATRRIFTRVADLEEICTAAEGSLEALFARAEEGGWWWRIEGPHREQEDRYTAQVSHGPGSQTGYGRALAASPRAALLSALTEAEGEK